MSAAEVLAAHAYLSVVRLCSCWAENWDNADVMTPRGHAAHQLDALKAAGYEIVRLPERDDAHPEVVVPAWSVREESGPMRIQSARARDRAVEVECERLFQALPPGEARAFAVALLAAANAAEANS